MSTDVIKALLMFALGLGATLTTGAVLVGLAAWQRWREERQR